MHAALLSLGMFVQPQLVSTVLARRIWAAGRLVRHEICLRSPGNINSLCLRRAPLLPSQRLHY